MALGLVVQGYSVWKLRHALHWRSLTPILIGTALGVPLGVFTLSNADPRYLRLGIGAVLVLFSLYGLWRPTLKHATGSRWDRRGNLVSIARLGQGSAAPCFSQSALRRLR
jgi:uncharacterized membrane protein YfcA